MTILYGQIIGTKKSCSNIIFINRFSKCKHNNNIHYNKKACHNIIFMTGVKSPKQKYVIVQ